MGKILPLGKDNQIVVRYCVLRECYIVISRVPQHSELGCQFFCSLLTTYNLS